MPTLNIHSGQNTRNAFILGIFIFLFSLFFQAPSFGSFGSSFFDSSIYGVNIAKGETCVPETPIQPPVEGLVPCGRIIDNQATPLINEHAPCDICALFYMLKNTLNLGMEISLALVVLIFVISGILYAFSAGKGHRVEQAKNAIYYTLVGLVVMFAAWLVVASALKALGYGDIDNWDQINCNITPGGPPTVLPFCGDGIVNNGELCDWAATPLEHPCQVLVAEGLPSYCEGIMSPGTRTCNCTCDGWNACVATNPPDLNVTDAFKACKVGDVYENGYSCCEITACDNDVTPGDPCCQGANATGATVPSGYTEMGTAVPCSNCLNPLGTCKIGRAGNSWSIDVNHTRASYRCWK